MLDSKGMIMKLITITAVVVWHYLGTCSANKCAQFNRDINHAGHQVVNTKAMGKSIQKGGHNIVKGTKKAVKKVGKEIDKMGDQIEKRFDQYPQIQEKSSRSKLLLSNSFCQKCDEIGSGWPFKLLTNVNL